MRLTAAATRTIPQRPAAVNPRTIEITATRQRCDYRRDVVYDTRLSPGARLLYVALDDYSGANASCWPHQSTLAARLGMSLRSIELWTAELKRAGYLIAAKTAKGNRYMLPWGHPQPVAGGSKMPPAMEFGSDPQPAAGAIPLYEPDQLTGCSCSGTGWIEYTDQRREGQTTHRVRCGCAV